MTKLFYKFALVMAVITYLTCSLNGISWLTSLFRSVVVFLGILFTIYLSGYVLQFALFLTTKNNDEGEETT
ncbi:MAG: hypothetical protein D6762_09400 [Candidatus Neomarinimicrobiota bacterium]|nr:MAG: hypothetical protein D6762_09400 [Candidatus Neomarinimicrobiota bacterium]